MATTAQQYAVRLSVDGGGRVRAELASVGESGERSLKRVERGGQDAGRGLSGVATQARALRAGIGMLAGALAGLAAGGGFAMLMQRSLATADAIGKTADKLGVGIEALQELRYAASLAGVEQNTLESSLERFTRRAAEAARGTGEAREALGRLGIVLLDGEGRLRRTEALMGEIAEAFRGIDDPAERVRLAFQLFGREGVAMVNMLRNGASAIEDARRRARDLGLVLDEALVRNAESARDELETLSRVISANLTPALLDLAPLLGDASRGLAGLAADAGVAYEQLKLILQGDFNLEGLSLRATERIVAARRRELAELGRALGEIGEVRFVDDPAAWARKMALERQLQQRVAAYRQWAAKLAWMQQEAARERPRETGADTGSTADAIAADLRSAEERSRRLVQIEQELQRRLFEARHEGAARIRAEFHQLVEEMQGLIAPDGSNLDRVERLLQEAATLRDARLADLDRWEQEAARRREDAGRRIVETLRAERDELVLGDRERAISQALRRLSAEATEAQRQQVRELAGALFDERQAIEARSRAEEEGRKLREAGAALTARLRSAEAAHADELRELNALHEAGAISQEVFARASEEAHGRMLRASRDWSAGVRRAIRDYLDEAADAARQLEQATKRALRGSEDAFVQWARTGKLSASDLFNSIAEEALRAAWRMAAVRPLGGMLESLLGSIGGALFGGGSAAGPAGAVPPASPVMIAHQGGVIGHDSFPARVVPPALFANAPRYHRGGLLPGEVAVIARRGERVLTEAQQEATARTIAGLATLAGRAPTIAVQPTVYLNAPNVTARTQASWSGRTLKLDVVVEQIEEHMARNLGRGEGIAPVMERRYGLNPAAGAFR